MKSTATVRAVPVLLFLLLVGCGDSPTSPAEEGPLRLTGSSSRDVVTAGNAATLTFRLENTGPSTITLTFTSSCQLMPYIAGAWTGHVVYPGGGGWGCLTVMTELTLPPGGVKTVTVEVRAGGEGGTADLWAVLSPGTYRAYAKLEDTSYRLRSKPILLKVQ